MTPTETRYETHDYELVTIVETFETWLHYSEGCKYKVLGYRRVIYEELELPTDPTKARLSWRTLSEMRTPRFFIVYNSC